MDGRLRLKAGQCNYKEIDRQLKKHFIHRFNDNDMLVEIILELTKTEENKNVTIQQVLAWEKRVEVQRAQSAIINSLNDIKEFN